MWTVLSGRLGHIVTSSPTKRLCHDRCNCSGGCLSAAFAPSFVEFKSMIATLLDWNCEKRFQQAAWHETQSAAELRMVNRYESYIHIHPSLRLSIYRVMLKLPGLLVGS